MNIKNIKNNLTVTKKTANLFFMLLIALVLGFTTTTTEIKASCPPIPDCWEPFEQMMNPGADPSDPDYLGDE
jgi:hypothetical protein